MGRFARLHSVASVAMLPEPPEGTSHEPDYGLPLVISQKRLAQELGCSQKTISNQRHLGTFPIPTLPLKGRPRWSRFDVVRFLQTAATDLRRRR